MTLDTSVPFTRQAALAVGLTDDELQGPRFRRVFQGVYVRAGIKITVQVRAAAALLVAAPGSYVSHHTAARLWGAWAPRSAETHISEPGDRPRRQRRGICTHRSDPDLAPVSRRGVPLAPPIHTFLQLAAHELSLVELVAVGDSLVHAERVTVQQLLDAADTWTGPKRRRVRRAAYFVRSGVDSVMETRLRLLMVLARLPEPRVDLILRAEDGSWTNRIDLSYPGIKLAIEYEGRQHAESVKQWNKDIRRRTALEAQGWRFILVTAEGIFDHPEETLAAIKDAMRMRGLSVTTRRPTVEWYREFVGEPLAA